MKGQNLMIKKHLIWWLLLLNIIVYSFVCHDVFAEDTTINYKGQPVPSAMAPSMSAFSQDVCGIGVSAAANGGVFSFAGGTMITDTNCVKLKWSKFLHDSGLKVAAVSVACSADHSVWEAMEMSGSPCPIGGAVGDAARRAWFELHPEWYEKLYGKTFTLPLVTSRSE
jgi:hypothetical protein